MDIECPYCKEDLDIDHTDGFGYEEYIKHEMTCEHCDKHFTFETSILFCYEASEAPCLNGDNHVYTQSYTFPKEFTTFTCKYCDDTRNPTDSEMKIIMSDE